MKTVQLKIDGYVINILTQNLHLKNVAVFVTENNLTLALQARMLL